MLRFSPKPNGAHLIRWVEWEGDAFRGAREQDKPVMLFLSAFWCRYCQRMDEEAFSDRENMALLNAYFIALRVDEAMRPDIDARYNLNGWPTLAFFSPDGELLAAANFLGAEDFKNLLLNVYLGYRQMDKQKHSGAAQPVPEQLPRHHAKVAHKAILDGISQAVMAAADRTNGGYGCGQKFVHAWVNEFLIYRYETTKNAVYLDHVRLTLERMRQGQIHDSQEGGYFRTTTHADWSEPHREKLLVEQAGLLSNCLHVFRLTADGEYARMAEDIIGYLDRKLWDARVGAFFGCEDFLRRVDSDPSSAGDFVSVIDRCIYTEANAVAASAYLQAGAFLGRADCKERALRVLDFLWSDCHSAGEGMCHYHDGEARLSGLLRDQALTGRAMLDAYVAAGDANYLGRARELADTILARLKNAAGGFHDRADCDRLFLKSPLVDLDQNGAAASFLTALAGALHDANYADAGRWALAAVPAEHSAYDIHAVRFGRALAELAASG